MEAFRICNRRTARRLEAWQTEANSSASIENEKNEVIESLLKRNAILEKQVRVLKTDNEMKARELAEQYELNEIQTFYIQNLESKMLSLKLKVSNEVSDLLSKLKTDEYTKTIISKIAVLHETLLTFTEKAESEGFEERSKEFDDQIRKAKITKPPKNELLQHETELTSIKHKLQTNLTEKREMVERMTSALKKAVDDINGLLSKHTLDIMEQVQTYEKELSPILHKLAKTEKTLVEKYQEILKVLQEPDDVHSSMSEVIQLNVSIEKM